MGMILHDWNLEKKLHLIRAAYEALRPGGAFVAIEHLIDDARRENAFGLMMSLNMLIEFGDAFDYTGADFAGWCTEVGFRETRVIPLTPTASAAVACQTVANMAVLVAYEMAQARWRRFGAQLMPVGGLIAVVLLVAALISR